jgi:hypothetical protein
MDIREIARDFVGAFVLFYGAFMMLFYAGDASKLIGLGEGVALSVPVQVTGAIAMSSLLSALGFTILRLKLK